jgi:hypothetical protein
MNKGMVVIIFSILSFNIILSGCIENDSFVSLSLDQIPPVILFEKYDDSLMVLTAGHNLNWSDIQVTSGDCDLPSGFIKAGDKITNCTGLLIFVWIPSNTVIGKWNF